MVKRNLAPLVIKAQSGNKDALNDLMGECYETLYYYAFNTVKNENLAADITQESCMEIIKTIQNLRNPDAFMTWAGRIVAHQCSRYYRQTKNEVYLEENEDGDTVLDRLPDESRGSLPEQVQEDREFKEIMWQMLDALPAEQRQALLLYYMDNLSVAEIAQIQGRTEGTVKSRLNYGRKAVMAKVNDYEKKHNIKLHSIAPLPLLLYFLFRENMAQVLADSAATLEKVRTVISGAVTSAVPAAAVAAGTATAGTVTTTAGAAVAGGLTAKIVAGVAAVVAGVVATGVAVVAVMGGMTQNQSDPFEEFEGQWLSIPIRQGEGSISDITDPMTIDGNTLSYQNRVYNLRFADGEVKHESITVLAATPEDVPVPDSDTLTPEDAFYIEFQERKEGNIAYLFQATETTEVDTYYEMLTPFYREADYQDYVKITLTEENITKYIRSATLAYDSECVDDYGVPCAESTLIFWIDESYGTASYCSFTPAFEYDIVQSRGEAYLHSVQTDYGVIGCGQALRFANNTIPVQVPAGTRVRHSRLVGANDVSGVVFIPKDWEENHQHHYEEDCRITADTHQWFCRCGQALDAESHQLVYGVCACGYLPTSEGLEFSVDSRSCSLVGIGTCTDTDIVIPSSYQGLPVTKIAANAFRNNQQITGVFIPPTVKSIEQWAFMGCENLKKIEFSEGLRWTEDLVFIWCTSLEEIRFPSTLTATGHSLFNECIRLKHVEFPEGMTEIKHGMLSNCDALTSVTIPASVTTIGDKAFWHCTNLKEIHYGGTVEQWNAIDKQCEQTWSPDGTWWSSDTGEFTVYCMDGELHKSEAG